LPLLQPAAASVFWHLIWNAAEQLPHIMETPRFDSQYGCRH
jgi:hypothetical protein